MELHELRTQQKARRQVKLKRKMEGKYETNRRN